MDVYKLYFSGENGKRYVITAERKDLLNEIRKDISTNYPHFKVHYTREWTDKNGVINFDVGSHTEFYLAYKTEPPF